MKKSAKSAVVARDDNAVKFRLLILIPAFQSDVKDMRDEYGIKDGGFTADDDYKKWDTKILMMEDGARPARLMEYISRVHILGKKYKLPQSFYTDSGMSGLRAYIERGVLGTPPKWQIVHDTHNWDGTIRVLSLKTFARLNQQEMRKAIRMLKHLQMQFPKEIRVDARVKKNFLRDLDIFSAFQDRLKKPITKSVERRASAYMEMLIKSGKISPSKIKELERDNPEYRRTIENERAEITRAEIAKKFHVKTDAARKAVERISDLIEAYFGTEFRPDANRNT